MPNPRPAGTTTDMIMRAPTDGVYRIYDLGNNQVLNGETNPLWPASSIAPATDWDFAGANDAANPTAVLGAVEWNFAKNTQDIFLRNKTSGVLAVYNINTGTNTLASGAVLGAIGLDVKIVGFGYGNGNAVSNPVTSGQADIIMSLANPDTNTTAYTIYDTVNDQFTTIQKLADLGSNWKALGVGEYVDFKTFAALMVVRTDSDTGTNNSIKKDTMQAYAISNNTLVSVSSLGQSGLDFIGFGHFSSQFALGMLMRDPTTGSMRIYDFSQNPSMGTYSVASPDSNIIISGTAQLGADWKPVGIVPMSGTTASSDLVMRQDGTGAMLVFDIRDDKLVTGGSSVFLPANSVPADWRPAFGGDFLSTSSASTSQLVQAMASFDDGSGAAGGANAAPLAADTSQQSFLTMPQHS
jgi:hypothetical protein